MGNRLFSRMGKKSRSYKQTGKVVERVFMASASDWRVAPSETSFPNLPNSKFELISGQSHVTIIDSVKERVISIISDSNPRPIATWAHL